MLTQLHEKESAIRRLEEDKERISHENLQLRTRLELVADLHDQTKEEMGAQVKAVTDALEYERAEHASEWHAKSGPLAASHQHLSLPLCAWLSLCLSCAAGWALIAAVAPRRHAAAVRTRRRRARADPARARRSDPRARLLSQPV